MDRGEGITFTGLTATKLEGDKIEFTVQFTADRKFFVSVFNPPNGNVLSKSVGTVGADSTSISFTLDRRQLMPLNELTISFHTGSGDDENLNFIGISTKEIERICE